MENIKGLEPLYAQAEARAVKKRKGAKEGEKPYDDCAIVTGAGSWIGWRNRFLENKMPYKVNDGMIYI